MKDLIWGRDSSKHPLYFSNHMWVFFDSRSSTPRERYHTFQLPHFKWRWTCFLWRMLFPGCPDFMWPVDGGCGSSSCSSSGIGKGKWELESSCLLPNVINWELMLLGFYMPRRPGGDTGWSCQAGEFSCLLPYSWGGHCKTVGILHPLPEVGSGSRRKD